MLPYSVDPRELAGKRAIVTGGTQGIGAAIVERLSSAGATVVATARGAASKASAALFIPADLSTAAGIKTVESQVNERLGGVDMIVSSIGGSSAPGGGFAVLTALPGAAGSARRSRSPPDGRGAQSGRCITS